MWTSFFDCFVPRAIGNIFLTQWWEEREAYISLWHSACDLSGLCTHAGFRGSFVYSYPLSEVRVSCFLDIEGAILSEHQVLQASNKSIVVFLKVELLQMQFINNVVEVCSTSTEVVKVLLLTISSFTSHCYPSNEEVSHGPMSHLQALLAVEPCPLWSCARHCFIRKVQ